MCTCIVRISNAILIFKYYFSGNEKIILENADSGNLTFNHVTIEDAGNYLCETGNGIGDILKKYARLYVHGKMRKRLNNKNNKKDASLVDKTVTN